MERIEDARSSEARPGLAQGSRVAVLAAMLQELVPIVRRFSLGAEEHAFGRVRRGRAGSHELVAAVTSMGTEAATRVTTQLLDAFAVDHVIVVGIAGGIGPELEIGDLVCPEVAVLDETGREVRPTSLGSIAVRGKLLTTDRLYSNPQDLERLRSEGFLAVDMETAAIGAVAEARGIPWTAFRAISDFAGDPQVDADVVGLAKPDGSANPGAIVRFLLTKPWRIPKLVVLGRGMRRAVGVSTRAVIETLR